MTDFQPLIKQQNAGQIDEHPRSWSIDVEQGYKAIAYFYVNDGARPAWIHWSPN